MRPFVPLLLLVPVLGCATASDPCVQTPSLCTGAGDDDSSDIVDDDSVSAPDDDTSGDDDSSTSDDDTSTGDDDTSAGNDDSAAGDDDDDDDGPPLPALDCLWIQELPAVRPAHATLIPVLGAGPAAAVDWALRLASFDDPRALRDGWYDTVAARTVDACPAFVHVQQQGGVPCYGANSMTFDQDSWTGCTNDLGEAVASTIVSTLRQESCAGTGTDSGVVTEEIGAFGGQLTVANDALPDAGPGEWLLDIDLDWSEVRDTDSTTTTDRSFTWTMALTHDDPAVPWVEDFLPGEDLWVDARGELHDVSDAGGPVEWELARSGTAGLCPQTLELAVSWDITSEGTSAAGCAVEAQGEVSLVLPDFWDGPPQVVTVTYDGANSCDGCADLRVDGALVGSFCL